MRILATNPDTIGDVVLRQPLYQALQKAGHELMLVTRPLLESVMPAITPDARLAVVPLDLYDPEITRGDPGLDEVAERAREFAPDILLVAPFQWTVLEERLAIAVADAKVVALTGRFFADAWSGPAAPSMIRPTISVEVTEDTPEVRKNEKLAGAILGRTVALPDPQLIAQESHVRAAEAELSRLGLEPGGYWIACVGHSKNTEVRNWSPARWGQALSAWARTHNRRFLFVGLENERPSAEVVREAMGDQGAATAEWFGTGPGSLEVLLGLTALSRGYVGRDTGPMHIAAALGKPVLAVFGGGTWPRFLPSVDPSVSITIGVPCAGCGWLCHLEDSYCIKEVPVEEVVRAADGLEQGSFKKRTTRLIKPDPELLARIGREGAATARQRLTQIGVLRREIKVGGGPVGAAIQKAVRDVSEDGARLGRIQQELAIARRRLEVNRDRIVTLQRLASEHSRARAAQAAVVAATREQLIEANARAAALEKKLEERITDLLTTRSDLAVLRDQARNAEKLESKLREQAEQARAGFAKANETLEARNREIAALRAQGGPADPDLRQKLSQARAEAAVANSGLVDLKLKIARFESDQSTLANLTKEQEGEIVVLRQRLHDLMASRWRKLGQRLGVAMTMPWERDGGNGRA